MILFFDTETSGRDRRSSLLQLAVKAMDFDLERCYGSAHFYVNSTNHVPEEAYRIHHIDSHLIATAGIRMRSACSLFYGFASVCEEFVAHNFAYDDGIMSNVLDIVGITDKPWRYTSKKRCCTMLSACPDMQLVDERRPNSFKWPRLNECISYYNLPPNVKAHDAMADVDATINLYRVLRERGLLQYV